MATHQWLSRAPIVEAVVELTVIPRSDARGGALDALPARLVERYPRAARRLEATARGHAESHRFTGEAPYVVEASPEGLTCTRLAPYGGFGPLVGEALWAWEPYVELARPARIVRLAVRFQNRFEVPLPLELDRLFLTGPRVAPSLPQTVTALDSRLTLQHGADTHSLLAQRIELLANERARVGVDIEVRRAVDLAPDSHRIWQGLGELASIEHHLFFETLTDEALAPYV
jgi:uncharacterized protein (TIGR04255 family)